MRMYYDAAGRTAVSKFDSLNFNANHQAICCTTSTTLEYRYDALGRLLNRPDGSGGYILGIQDGHNLLSFGGTGTEIIHGPDVDEPLVLLAGTGQSPCGFNALYFITNGNRLFDFHNANGNNCVGTAAWDTFGKNSGAIADSYSFGLNRSKDIAGVSYLRNRFYHGSMGRFTQEDPIGFGGGDNLYAYAGNNPALDTDAFGLCPDKQGKCWDQIPYAPVEGIARKRDPRLDFGSLIDMTVPGGRAFTGGVLPLIAAASANPQCAAASLGAAYASAEDVASLLGFGLVAKGAKGVKNLKRAGRWLAADRLALPHAGQVPNMRSGTNFFGAHAWAFSWAAATSTVAGTGFDIWGHARGYIPIANMGYEIRDAIGVCF
jgi:RHS repeat-associated protein